MKNKIFFTDMDGTLLDGNKKISDENKARIKEYMELGGKFSLATGRTLKSVENFLHEIEVNLPMVLFNGALVYDLESRKIVAVKGLEKELLKEIFAVYKKASETLDVTILAYDAEEIYYDRDTEYLRKQLDLDSVEAVETDLDPLLEKDIVKVIFVGPRKDLEELKKLYHGYNCFFSNSNILEILSEGVTKWWGIERIIECFEENRGKEVYAVGDNFNDLDMIINADVGVAMKNSAVEIQKMADWVTTRDNNSSGVAEMLEKIILNNR